ncbi:NAD(P)/FAD-dependent oxidoreductase [Streptomyces sp. URMC 123]|uniref:NAD(P)/FAD-dependent oxidoreductase n=1 Tax=Streptomyces sp. URMC 123 TaxID=3423403 RepID=UPI003F1CFA93
MPTASSAARPELRLVRGVEEQVVVVGGGQAGFQAVTSLRESGWTGRVALVAGEGVLPYLRPPLSKSFLIGPGEFRDVALRPESYFGDHGIDVHVGDRAVAIDRAEGRVVLASGRRLPYDRLVLALGARPRPLPVPGAALDGVQPLRSFADAAALRHRLAPGRRLVVIGGGLLGMETAAAARVQGVAVTVVEARERVMARSVSREVSAYLTAEHARNGVTVLVGRRVTALAGDARGRVRAVELADGTRLPADLVLIGTGVLPDTSLAASAGLAVGDGILVDEYLRTSDPAIHAIGDCARFPSRQAGGHIRLESVQNAMDQARYVAAGICGRPEPYVTVPWFWTDQYAVKVQIVGMSAGHDRAAVTGDPATGRFSVLCFRGHRLVAVESVNRPADHIRARRLLSRPAETAPATAARAPGRLFGEALGASRVCVAETKRAPTRSRR